MAEIDRSTVWPYDERGQPRDFLYQRYGHPTGAEAEAALGGLEGGEALLYASGTSAVTACAFALLQPGATVAVAEGAYFGTTVTLRELEPWGLKVTQ
ncbi:MAG TPA: PLP-dependent transferase, partial [Gaiellaceae bacterium]|nr:PLP-dependent transferase [Gaiellaceae bacterium]